MKANEDKLLEKLVDGIMKDSKLETPSSDFTTKLMSQVLATKTSEVYLYKPLISKPVFILIIGCVISLFIYLFVNREVPTNSWVNYLNFRTVFNYHSTSLFNFSKIAIYSIVFATLLLFIQISFLKKQFENQFK